MCERNTWNNFFKAVSKQKYLVYIRMNYTELGFTFGELELHVVKHH